MIVKMNAVVDPPVIQALYRRVAGWRGNRSDRSRTMRARSWRARNQQQIRVRSIVGRFLEHSRIYYFENGGKPELYLGSADWMPRNLYERVEAMFPFKDPQLCERVCNEILSSYLADTRKARLLQFRWHILPRPSRCEMGTVFRCRSISCGWPPALLILRARAHWSLRRSSILLLT